MTATPITLRLARSDDVPLLEALIPLSARALQATTYSPTQIKGALGTVFAGDRQLVAALAGEPLYAAFAFQVVERYDVALANGLSLPVVRMAKALAPR